MAETEHGDRTHARLHRLGQASWFVVPAVVSVVLSYFAWRLWRTHKWLTAEDQLLESWQAVFLTFAFGVHLLRWLAASTRPVGLCHLTLAMLCVSVLLREVDVDQIGDAAIWSSLETILRLTIVVAWLIVLQGVGHDFPILWRIRWEVLLSIKSALTFLAIVLYAVSRLFDKHDLPVEEELSRLLEEVIQLSATIFFFAGALKPLRVRAMEPTPTSRSDGAV